MDLNTLPTFVNSCRTVLIESQQLDSGVEKIKTKQNKNSMPFSFIKIFSPHSHLFQVLEMSEQENWFCFSEPFLTCRKNRERGCFLFFGLKLFLWNGKKSHSVIGLIGEPWGAGAVRLLWGTSITDLGLPARAVWKQSGDLLRSLVYSVVSEKI